jgi:diguanylate cyclase (GGDEF)-like protein/PAS domain S-box-containing protein
MHRLLKRQLKKVFNKEMPKEEDTTNFITLVNQAYHSFTEEQGILERSLDISSLELTERNKSLNSILDALPDTCLWLDKRDKLNDIRLGQRDLQLVSHEDKLKNIDQIDLFQNSPCLVALVNAVRGGKNVSKCEFDYKTPNNDLVIEARLALLGQGNLLLLFRDITRRKAIEQLKNEAILEFERTQQQLQNLINSAPIGIFIVNKNQVITMVNDFMLFKLDLEHVNLIGSNPLNLIHKKYRSAYLKQLTYHLTDKTISKSAHIDAHIDVCICTTNGNQFSAEIAFSTLLIDNKTHVTQAITDISERKKLEKKLWMLASTDPLTGAYNRRYFNDAVEQELLICQRYDHDFSLLEIDIDNFKKINDTYGHAAGDEVLKALVIAVENLIREVDLLGRFGGEEFIVALVKTPLQEAIKVSERIRVMLSNLVLEISGKQIRYTVSIGLTTRLNKDDDLESLLNKSDLCLYEAKRNGRNQVVVWQESLMDEEDI